MERRRTTTWATTWPRSTPSRSSVASSPGSRHKRGFRPKSSPSMARRCDGPVRRPPRRRKASRVRSTSSPHSPRANVSFSARSKVGEKSNEIIAIPKLLRMLQIEGAIVTIDAMGCQRYIAQTIIDKKADYILALKGNQGTLKDDVKLFVDEQKAVDFKDAKVSRDKTVEADHGRIEIPEITVIHDVEWLQERHDW